MSVKIEVLDLNKAIKYVNKKNKKAVKLIDDGVIKATLYVFGKIKESIYHGTNAPVAVDTSLFGNTIQLSEKGNDARIFSDLSYSKYIEYGTSKMKARPHFRNTAAKERVKVKKILDASISKL